MADRAARLGVEQAPLTSYRRALAERFRWLPQPWEQGEAHHLNLSRLLIDLTAQPLRPAPRGLPPALARSSAAPTARDLVAAAGARAALVGGPGSGKSLLIQALSFACCAAALGEPAEELPLPESWRADPPLPLLLSAAECDPMPEAWLARTLARQHLEAAFPTLLAHLSGGRCLVLIDCAAAPADDFENSLAALVAAYGASRFLVVARDAGLAEVAEQYGFRGYQLNPPDQVKIDTFIGRWTEERARARNIPLDEPLKAGARRVQAATRASAELHALASRPGTLVACMLAHEDGIELLPQRQQLYARIARQQLLAAHSIVPIEGALHALAALAAELANTSPHSERPATIALADLEQLLHTVDARLTAAQLRALPDACLRVGLLVADTHAKLGFAQPGLARYLAACHLRDNPETVAQALALRHQAAWRPILPLLALLLADAARRDDLAALLRGLLEPEHAQRESCRPCLLLAAAMLAEQGVAAELPALLPQLRERLLGLLIASVPLPERIEAGMLLGVLGDPRTDTLAPDTIEIPQGPFLLGDDHPAYADEGPAAFVELATFRIARHPVTNRDYERFLAANPAYPRPRYWHDPAHTNPSQPVVGVTWYDACAYCAWLTAQLRAADRLDATEVVRLPHEFEWEKAASWDAAHWAKRRFPWGDEWQPSWANTADERGAWTTTPIGCYPCGVSPYGAHDMIGNVWEWTANEYASYPGAPLPFYEPAKYVLRGASCQSLASNARNSFRNRLPPDYWRHHLGFRIVIAPPL
jgi:gamma-glutamyl hercynylcysteine S-oxide synthase